VGRVVLAAAAKNLTPVTLELGGKSPVYIDESADLKLAARRIADGRFMNTGQICVAPDYVLCHRSVAKQFVDEVNATIKKMFGEDPKASNSLGRLVNTRHWERVAKLIETADGELITGGLARADKATKYIPPTVIYNVTPTCPVMQEEVFGPVLSVLPVDNVDVAIKFINAKDRALALYVFAENTAVADKVITNTHSGGVCVNDTIMHLANPELPFGGTGPSGMGAHHGVWSFNEFTHFRAVMFRSSWFDNKGRYAPYNEAKLPMLKKILMGSLIPKHVKLAVQAVLFVGLAFAAHRVVARLM